MDIKSLFKKDFIVGLDVGTDSVKFVEFRKKDEELYLLKAELRQIKHLDEPARTEETISVLKDLFKGVDAVKTKVVVCVNGPKTLIKMATVPYMPKEELREAIELGAKNYFPFPINESLLDIEIVKDVRGRESRKCEVMLAVSPKSTIAKYLFLMEKANIKPASMVPCAYAFQKLAVLSCSRKEVTTCFMDMGRLNTELLIFKGEVLMFTRKVPVVGEDLTEAIAGIRSISEGDVEHTRERAEKIKKEAGIPSTDEVKDFGGGLSTMHVLTALRTPLEHLLSEVERCFDYYREETGGGKIDSLVVSGGGAAMDGFVELLSRELVVNVRTFDPYEYFRAARLPESIKRISYRFAPAIGAAVSADADINLLPVELKEELTRTVKRISIRVVIAVAVTVTVLIYGSIRIQLGNFQKRILFSQKELSDIQSHLKKAEAYHLANMVLVAEPHWEDIFRELSNLIPNDMYLTSMTVQKGTLTMNGVVTGEDGERDLSDFMLSLGRGIFRSVKLVRVKVLKDRSGNEFEIECLVE